MNDSTNEIRLGDWCDIDLDDDQLEQYYHAHMEEIVTAAVERANHDGKPLYQCCAPKYQVTPRDLIRSIVTYASGQ